MNTTQNILGKIGNYFVFKGDLNRLGFLIMLTFAAFVYCLILEVGALLNDTFFQNPRLLPMFDLFRGQLFCYFYGLAIAARLRNMKLNPSLAYFFVFLIWTGWFFTVHSQKIYRYETYELCGMMMFFILLPLFAKDKNVWKF